MTVSRVIAVKLVNDAEKKKKGKKNGNGNL
jgi:hypothetical protein